MTGIRSPGIGRLESWAQSQWYERADANPWLLPLEQLFAAGAALRRAVYRRSRVASRSYPVPILVVGNLTVGGVGKTPLVLWLAAQLAAAGRRPGIVSRGYGGQRQEQARWVAADADPAEVGDEPLLLAQRSGAPVYVHHDRSLAVKALLAQQPCDVVISDDGLQHYALRRDLEIVVVDGTRRFGNGHLLPAGPLREPLTRLATVDLIVCNGGEPAVGEWPMSVSAQDAINLVTGERRPLLEFADDPPLAVAGIGNPDRFFQLLAKAGIRAELRPFPDHHHYQPEDLPAGGRSVLMTEKDAVKCRAFAAPNHWFVPVTAQLPQEFSQRLFELLEARSHGQETA